MKPFYKTLLAVSIASLITACSGGGGKGGSTTPPASSSQSPKATTPQAEHKPQPEHLVAPPPERVPPAVTPPATVQPQPPATIMPPAVTPPAVVQPQPPATITPPAEDKSQPESIPPVVTPPAVVQPQPPAEDKPQPESIPPVVTPPATVQPQPPATITPPAEDKPQPESIPPAVTPPAVVQPQPLVTITPPAEHKPQPEHLVAPPPENVPPTVSEPALPQVEQPLPDSEPSPLPEGWSAAGDFPHEAAKVPVIELTDGKLDTDPDFIARKTVEIELALGDNKDPNNLYRFTLLDQNAYYGFYRDTQDMSKLDNHYVYSYRQEKENLGKLDQLNARYHGKFLYSTQSVPVIVSKANVHLTYQNGKGKGEITGIGGRKLFELETLDPRQLQLTPAENEMYLDNSNDSLTQTADRSVMPLHYIHGENGKANQYLLGKTRTEKYWGVLGAEQVAPSEPTPAAK